ncbi:MAG: proprotein convertase P-domain-containing protein [Pseudomonadota bacterium]
MKTIKTMSTLACAAALMVAGSASAGVIGSSTTPVAIQDPSGGVPYVAQSTITVGSHGSIAGLSVSIAAEHTWIGDLIYTLSHGGTTVTLMDRPGRVSSGVGDSSNLSNARPLVFSDTASLPAETIGATCTGGDDTVGIGAACLNTAFLSHQALSAFAGADMFGDWTLSISDNEMGDRGMLAGWSLSAADATTQVPEPGMLALLGLAMSGMFAARRRSPK